MSQPATSSRLTNSTVNINGAANISTTYGLASIGVTGNNFDISALSTGNNISIGANGTRNVTIGSAASGTVSLPGTTTFATLNSPAVGTGMSVGGNLTTGILTLGSLSSTTNLFGVLDVKTIEGPTAGSDLTIGNNISAGSISIGNAGGPNTVTIGSNSVAGATGTVNVGVSSNLVNIGTSGLGGEVIIGSSGTTGFTNIYSTSVRIRGGATGSISIGAGLTQSTAALNIGNDGLGPIFIGAGGNRGGTLDIGTGGTGNIFLGNVLAPLALRGSTTTFSSPLTLGTAPGYGATGTGSGATTLGSSYFVSIAGLTAYNGNIVMPAVPPIVPRGTWLVNYVFKCPGTTPTVSTISTILTQVNVSTSTPNISTGTFQIDNSINVTSGIGTTGSAVIKVTDDITTISLLVIFNYTAGGPLFTNAASNIQLTRIA